LASIEALSCPLATPRALSSRASSSPGTCLSAATAHGRQDPASGRYRLSC